MSKIVKAITKLFTPKIPKVVTPFMPDPGSAASKLAAQQKVENRKKNGRDSTIYSGAAYGGQNLGGTA
jgi:hypothetical protein